MRETADEKGNNVWLDINEEREKGLQKKISVSAKEKGIIELIRAREDGELRIMIRKNEPVMAEDKVRNIQL